MERLTVLKDSFPAWDDKGDGIGVGTDPKEGQALQRRNRSERASPERPVPGDKLALVEHVGCPALEWRQKYPARIAPNSDLVVSAGPFAGCHFADDVAITLGGLVRGRTKVPVQDDQLDDGVKQNQGFVMRHMFLCLAWQDERKGQSGSFVQGQFLAR